MDESSEANLTIDFAEAASCYRELLERQHDLALDLKGLATTCRVSGIDAAALKMWIKAQIADERDDGSRRVEKLVAQSRDRAGYGEKLRELGVIPISTKNVFAPGEYDPETGEYDASSTDEDDRNRELTDSIGGRASR